MPKQYAIEVTENTLDLIEVLNGGVRPQLQPGLTTYFTCNVENRETTNPQIQTEDDLYDDRGYSKEETYWMWG